MNTPREGRRLDADNHFDQAMRDLHGQALARVSPSTRVRLRAARAASVQGAHPPGLRWALAAGFVAVFALAAGLQWRVTSSGNEDIRTQTAAIAVVTTDPGTVAPLDENPDLYLWLASNGDALPATWNR